MKRVFKNTAQNQFTKFFNKLNLKKMKRKNFSLMGRTFIGLAVAASAWMFSGFTAETEKALAEVCFSYNTAAPDDPDATQATTSTNYNTSSLSCGSTQETLCGICFDSAQFPLTGSGLPDFSATNIVLRQLVENNRTNFAANGVRIYAPAPNNTRWVILHFRQYGN